MGSRLALHSELLKFCPNVHFQPPASKTLEYPCIIYNKTAKLREYGNNGIYLGRQQYQLMVIDRSPDSMVADDIEESFPYCSIQQYYTVDTLNHTTLSLYY